MPRCGIGADSRRTAVASRGGRVRPGGWCCSRGARSAGPRWRVGGRRYAAWRCLVETTSGWSVALAAEEALAEHRFVSRVCGPTAT